MSERRAGLTTRCATPCRIVVALARPGKPAADATA
jgi:hypothetical protein